MDEGRELSDVDVHLRAALRPGAAATRRVLLVAFTDRSERIASRMFAIAAAAVLVLALGVGVGLWRRHVAAPATTSLRVTNQGSLIVVEGADGRRWIVGPAMERRAGSHYVIVISE